MKLVQDNGPRLAWVISIIGLALALTGTHAAADARSDYLVRLLSGSTQFRVRAQAAISLGGIVGVSDVAVALKGALRDEHPAVRAAAANSLGRLGDASALGPLRIASKDAEAPVRAAVQAAIAKLESSRSAPTGSGVALVPGATGPPRYYVAVAKTLSRVPSLGGADLDRANAALRARLAQLDGVVLAPLDETPTAVRSVLRARSLKGFYIDSSVTKVENKPGGGTRVAVSVILATYPERAMRAIMQGAATAVGGSDATGQAAEGAFRSAVSQLPQALSRD